MEDLWRDLMSVSWEENLEYEGCIEMNRRRICVTLDSKLLFLSRLLYPIRSWPLYFSLTVVVTKVTLIVAYTITFTQHPHYSPRFLLAPKVTKTVADAM